MTALNPLGNPVPCKIPQMGQGLGHARQELHRGWHTGKLVMGEAPRTGASRWSPRPLSASIPICRDRERQTQHEDIEREKE